MSGGLSVFAQGSANEAPIQVNVSVKVVEFQTSEGAEFGLSAYFKNQSTSQAVTGADITFPSSAAAGITIFLDRLGLTERALNVVLEALVQENRAYILSHPSAMVMVGENFPTKIETSQKVPYESTVVVGNTPIQVTEFKDTGVLLNVSVPEIIDDDDDFRTTNDTYIRLNLDAMVKEEGQRLAIALDDRLSGGIFSDGKSAIMVPEFVDRSIKTEVWVRHGQVLVMGGLYRDLENKNLSNVPWLADAENFLFRAVGKMLPGKRRSRKRLSNGLGNRQNKDERRELVFLIKVESWYPGLGPVPPGMAATELLSAGPDLGTESDDDASVEEEK
jgi:type II secretory pathway component GspD/PulD (secretin)